MRFRLLFLVLVSFACDPNDPSTDAGTDGPADGPSGRCDDAIHNGSETDVDCGGSCSPCAEGHTCALPTDCVTQACGAGVCRAASCADQMRNGDETGLDCGGACGPCPNGQPCDSPAGCVSRRCADQVCAAATCSDLVADGDETDVDCGGTCQACADGLGCAMPRDCASRVCSASHCAPASCSDAVRNGTETDVDCGGSCSPCTVGRNCLLPNDCTTTVCGTAHTCIERTCTDGVQNGSETATDCGGGCTGCADGLACHQGSDCFNSVCNGDVCVAPLCNDGVRNGTESDSDCGGADCVDCAPGRACRAPDDCASARCVGEVCAAPSCIDGVRNGAETDIDCGGTQCRACQRGQHCAAPVDCVTGGCFGMLCVGGPTAGFTLSPSTGRAPLVVAATSMAVAGDSAIQRTEYDFGSGFTETATATLTEVGVHTVHQRVTDAAGLTATAMRHVTVAPAYHCTMSPTDGTFTNGSLRLTDDQLGVEFMTLDSAGVRSSCSVGPNSGVWYFEATIDPYDCDPDEAPSGCYPTPQSLLNIGVATAAANLRQNPGSTNQGVDTDIGGVLYYNGEYQGNYDRESTSTWGFVVDYRTSTPTIHVLGEAYGEGAVLYSRTLTGVSAPVFAMVSGFRRKVGVEATFNFGNDTRAQPFQLDPQSILNAAGHSAVAGALVRGFSGTYASPANERPTLTAGGSRTIALGTTVNLTASAMDAEDGNLTSSILWENMATVYGLRDTGMGGTFTYTPREVGLHPIRLTVMDSNGQRRQTEVQLRVMGGISNPSPVRMENRVEVDPLVGSGIMLSPDGLSAKWTAFDKMGLRANAGLYGAFWYFEATRLGGPVNQGVGLVVREGELRPYQAPRVPPSVSLNTSGSTWQSIIYHGSYDTSQTTYGFAVDYRGEHAHVYWIVGGEVVDEWTMVDAFTPMYPMLYGNPTEEAVPYDIRANFGASPFAQNVCAALSNYGVAPADVGALRLGWGVHATSACP